MAIPTWLRRGFVYPNAPTDPYAVGLYQETDKLPYAEGRKMQVVWQRGIAGVTQDPAITTHHFVNMTAGASDSSWTDADFLVVEDAFIAFWTAIKTNWNAATQLDSFRWYRYGPNIPPPHPAVRIRTVDANGTGSLDGLPPQIAVAVTELTGVRRRWGRFYLPAPTEGTSTADAVMSTAVVDSIANAASNFYVACFDGDIHPVVFSQTLQLSYGVEKVQVDSYYDVIRSRRWSGNPYRKRLPATV